MSAEQSNALLQAHKLLGDGIVTEAAIHRLEDEGKLPRGLVAPDPFAKRKAPPSAK
jgi:hypothetical protein